ncbi:MAG: MmcQ/YjbR family DNA-binding protein [bacterium]
MNLEEIREYCLLKPEVTESLPFDDTSLVFKVNNKIFAILSLDNPALINLKCDPQIAIELRERYPFVIPGYHMNKQHWNSIMLEELTHDELLRSWIDDSYLLIVASMPKKDRERILAILGKA